MRRARADSSGGPAIDGRRGAGGVAGRIARGAGAAAGAGLLSLLLSAHAVVHPGVSPPGAYERYLLRVPNERDLPTVRIGLEFPTGVRVLSFADVPGWRLSVERDAGGAIVAAGWEGELGVGRFVELPFVAVNPSEETRLQWRATQTYADGEVVRWAGPEESSTPASFTQVREAGGGTASVATWTAGAALLLALLALGIALRPGGQSRDGGLPA